MGLCVSLDGSANQSSNEPAEERGSDLAPVLRVERSAVMAVVVAMVVVMTRLMMRRMSRRWRCVMRNFVPWRRTHRSRTSHSGGPSGGFRRMRRVLGRSRCLCRVWLLRRCLHRRRSLPFRLRVSLRSRHRRSAESAADRERHHHLLYCLVHCRVPFVIRASPFSRLHKDRTIRRNFLTKFQSMSECYAEGRTSRHINRGPRSSHLEALSPAE